MAIHDDIQKILEISVNAPSGSNSQPWRFEVKDNQINVIALPEKDHPILNYNYRGTWVAHGGLIENILISASNFGYIPRFKIFPDESIPNLTAQIVLEKGSSRDSALFDVISKRATNRNKYKEIPLNDEQKLDILNSSEEVGGGKVKLLANRDKMKQIGEAMSMNEIVMLENKTLHKLFFNEIVWNAKQEKERGGGLYLKTMGLKPPQKLALKIFKNWPAMNFANKLGMSKTIAKDNSKVYSSASALGAIIVNDGDKEFITAGRLMERVWLKATKMGLGFHLITGILFFWQRIKSGDTKEFSDAHIRLIEDAYHKIASIFEVSDDKLVALVFRIGYGGEPGAYSFKRPPDVKYK